MSVASASGLKLWYTRPAKVWVEALPLGNSSMGVMVYGGTRTEELQLNEETMWGGGPHRNDNPEALASLDSVRQLVFEGRNIEAQELIDKTFYSGRNGMPYQTVGSLTLDFPGHEQATDYYRELDISRAVATVTYKAGGVTYRREIFASLADRVVIVRLTADKPGAITFTAGYECPLAEHRVSCKGQTLALSGRGGDHEGVSGKIRMETRACVRLKGGAFQCKDGGLSVKGADVVTLYVASATNFRSYRDVSGNAERRWKTI